MKQQPTIQITLTPEQQTQIRQATGKAVRTLKLEALEERLAPLSPGRASLSPGTEHLN